MQPVSVLTLPFRNFKTSSHVSFTNNPTLTFTFHWTKFPLPYVQTSMATFACSCLQLHFIMLPVTNLVFEACTERESMPLSHGGKVLRGMIVFLLNKMLMNLDFRAFLLPKYAHSLLSPTTDTLSLVPSFWSLPQLVINLVWIQGCGWWNQTICEGSMLSQSFTLIQFCMGHT